MGYFEALALLKYAVAFGTLFIVYTQKITFTNTGVFLDRRKTVGIIFAVILLTTVEFWGIGNYSYVHLFAELEYSLPIHLFVNDWRDGDLFTQAFSGGNDLAAMATHTGQAFSFERALLSALPLWLASFAHKTLVYGTGIVGVYLISRRVGRFARAPSIAAGTLYALASHDYITVITWAHGLGYALIPLAIYICVFRIGKPNYFLGVICLAAFHTISCSPMNSFFALIPAIFLSAFLVSWRCALKSLPAIIILILFVLFNWHESLYAKMLVGPLTDRTHNLSMRGLGLLDTIKNAGAFFGEFGFWDTQIVLLASFIALAKRQKYAALLKTASVVVIIIFSGSILQVVPWHEIGLGLFEAIQFVYLSYAIFALTYVILALSFRPTDNAMAGRAMAGQAMAGQAYQKPANALPVAFPGRALSSIIVALAIGNVVSSKAYTVSNWLSLGGLNQVTQAREIADKFRTEIGENRVITVGYRLPAALLAAAGLETIDGFINLRLFSQATFWHWGVLRDHYKEVGQSLLKSSSWDMRCCESYEWDQHVDTRFLRIANVGYVFSKLPLRSDKLTQITHYDDSVYPVRNTVPIVERLWKYGVQNFSPSPIRVYRIAGALPRVFAATGYIDGSSTKSASDLLDLIGEHAIDRKIVSSQRPGGRGALLDAERFNAFTIISHAKQNDGMDISVDAPDGGVLVVNLPYSPFWTVAVDGEKGNIFPVNLVHMAIVLPNAARNVKLRYIRPTIARALMGNRRKTPD